MKNNRTLTATFLLVIITLLGSFKIKGANSIFKTNPNDSLLVIVPNVFSPNSDGINDTWSMILHDYGIILFDLQTTVYDRWGMAVFQTTDIREVWLGHTPTGKICNAGSYFYVIKYTNSVTNQLVTLKGFVELVR